MEAWNIYLSISIDHTPTWAVKLIACQCIITSASIQYPTLACLSYDLQFCTLAASDPILRWDARHTDLWLQCMTTTIATQSACWLWKHCSATNHYPDNCPIRTIPLPAITGGQWATTMGQHNSRPNTEPYLNQSRPITCRDFNCDTCCHPDDKFTHYYEHFGVNHAGRDCRSYGWPQHIC